MGSETEKMKTLPKLSIDYSKGEQAVLQLTNNGVIVSNVLIDVSLFELGAGHKRFTVTFMDKSPLSKKDNMAMVEHVKRDSYE